MSICSFLFNIVLLIATLGLLVALVIKREEAPLNFYLLLAFVRKECMHGTFINKLYNVPFRLLVRHCRWGL